MNTPRKKKPLIQFVTVADLKRYRSPGQRAISIDKERRLLLFKKKNMDPYEVDLDRINSERDLLIWVRH